MAQEYIVTESDLSDPNPKKRKNLRWLQWASEIGLKLGDKWTAVDYMTWVDSRYAYDR